MSTPPTPHDASEDVLSVRRRQASASSSNQDQETGNRNIEKNQRNAFSFVASFFEVADYFTVHGEKRRGLIIDPGAASGLIGYQKPFVI